MKLANELELENIRQNAENQRYQARLLIEQETALKIAQINADAKEDASEVKGAD
jgi:hypothetical protein